MNISNNSYIYNASSTTEYSELNNKGNSLQFTSSIKNVNSTPITMIRKFFNSHFPGGRKERQPNMRDLISKSYVVPDSGHTAKINFVNTPKFNSIETDVTVSEQKELLKDSSNVMNGNIRPLIGQGIISSTAKNDNFPVAYDYVRSDKDHESLSKNSANVNYGVEC